MSGRCVLFQSVKQIEGGMPAEEGGVDNFVTEHFPPWLHCTGTDCNKVKRTKTLPTALENNNLHVTKHFCPLPDHNTTASAQKFMDVAKSSMFKKLQMCPFQICIVPVYIPDNRKVGVSRIIVCCHGRLLLEFRI